MRKNMCSEDSSGRQSFGATDQRLQAAGYLYPTTMEHGAQACHTRGLSLVEQSLNTCVLDATDTCAVKVTCTECHFGEEGGGERV